MPVQQTLRRVDAGKAALTVAAMGPETAGIIVARMERGDAVKLAAQVAELGEIPDEIRCRVLKEFETELRRARLAEPGDEILARRTFQHGLEPEEAAKAVERLRSVLDASPFRSLKEVPAEALSNILAAEHPQTTALVLSYLRRGHAAEVLSLLDREYCVEVIRRIAGLQPASPETVSLLERVLQMKLQKATSVPGPTEDGKHIAAELLAHLAGTLEREVLEELKKTNGDLADEIGRMMFSFSDILLLDDAGLRTLVQSAGMMELAVSLKAAPEEIVGKVLSGISEEARDTFLERLEALGPQRVADIQAAQERIASLIKKLVERGAVKLRGA